MIAMSLARPTYGASENGRAFQACSPQLANSSLFEAIRKRAAYIQRLYLVGDCIFWSKRIQKDNAETFCACTRTWPWGKGAWVEEGLGLLKNFDPSAARV